MVSERVEEVGDTIPVGAITIEVSAEDVGVDSLLAVVSSTVEEVIVEVTSEVGEVVLTTEETAVVSVVLEGVGDETTEEVSDSEASRDDSKFDSEGEPWAVDPRAVKPRAVDPCEDESPSVRLGTVSVKDRPWLETTPAVVTSVLVDGTEDEEKVVTVTFVYALFTSRGKYILGLATGSALASVETAASAVTRSAFVCIL